MKLLYAAFHGVYHWELVENEILERSELVPLLEGLNFQFIELIKLHNIITIRLYLFFFSSRVNKYWRMLPVDC